jgi:predicted phage baseplate assembly protein
MSLAAPKLDDRTFQQLVDEAKKKIPHYTKEWTDHNVSDPGVTLIELFAWMTETMLYRLNRVPDLHYVKFMEMFGITLKPPAARQGANHLLAFRAQGDRYYHPGRHGSRQHPDRNRTGHRIHHRRSFHSAATGTGSRLINHRRV